LLSVEQWFQLTLQHLHTSIARTLQQASLITLIQL
jgi:hypothetical protein